MRTPFDNPEGYNVSSNLHQAANLKAPLLLVHGSADDNGFFSFQNRFFFSFFEYFFQLVHFQNSQMLSWEFIQAGIQVENVYYPNADHGINNGESRKNLYIRMEDFMRSTEEPQNNQH